MRSWLAFLFVLAVPVVAAADAYYLPIAGSVGAFRADVRIFNPADTDSNVTLVFIPVGNQNNGAAFAHPVTVVIPSRQAMAWDDMVATVFHASGIGAVYLDGTTPLLVTCRIYAQTANGTLGQGYRAENIGSLLTDGVLLQLRSDASFRTNIGIANLQNAPATVTWTLYDGQNHKVSEKTIRVENYGIIGPTNIASGFFFDTTGADLTDARVSFHSDVPIAVYASVIDNATTDPTYFTAMSPSGY
jgi:hypothetical protein